MALLVLMNPDAGSDRGNGRVARVAKALREAGHEAEVVCGPPARISELASKARADGYDAVVAGGGDGTVGTVAEALAGSDVPLAVLPLGTRNHFARDLGMPVGLADAAAALARARPRRIDVGEVNGRIFVNNASIGLYPRVVHERQVLGRRRPGLARGLATAWAAVQVIRRFRVTRVEIELAGERVVHRTPFVFVGNNEYRMHLFEFGARPCLDQGWLSLYTARSASPGALFRLAALALLDRLDQAHDFEGHCVREAWLDTSRAAVGVALDGEIVRMTPPLHFRSRPGALTVLSPEPS